MTAQGPSAARTLAEIEALGFTHVLMIPDGEGRLLYDAVRRSALPLITPCREGESIAIAAGLWTGRMDLFWALAARRTTEIVVNREVLPPVSHSDHAARIRKLGRALGVGGEVSS